jgi:hypothetical protein
MYYHFAVVAGDECLHSCTERLVDGRPAIPCLLGDFGGARD